MRIYSNNLSLFVTSCSAAQLFSFVIGSRHLVLQYKLQYGKFKMPLNAAGWSTEEDEQLIELVKPHLHLYHILDPSRNNILARVTTWQEIASKINKPVEECKKRWRGLRDGFMRTKRLGALHKRKIPIFEKLQFLDEVNAFDEPLAFKRSEDGVEDVITMVDGQSSREDKIGTEEVITDKQEYYEIMLVDEMQQQEPFLKLIPKTEAAHEQDQPPKKIIKRNVGRKKSVPIPQNLQPIKILPKPVIMREPRVVRCIETPKTLEQRSQTIDKLIEKVLKENTNEIDVFFRSMAASVKKLQPNLIPKVKMEVCNVIAKYEMQSFDKSRSIVNKEL